MRNAEEKGLAPRIRFAGFTDAWEQRVFADFTSASGARNRDGLPLKSYSVSNDRGFVPQDEQFEMGGTMRDADKTAYWIVEPGSFAYNPARINVGSIGYLSTSENVIVSSLYEVFRTDATCDDRFLWHWLKSSLFAKQIEMLQEGGVRLYYFFDKLLKSEIWMPSVSEQGSMGRLFDALDDLIALHQRKCDELKTVKKSLLEKMFPREGEATPELRFAGFTDAWEQRRLGEIASITRGERFTADDYVSENGIPCIHYGEIYTSYGAIATSTISQVRKELEPFLRFANPGDIIVAGTSENVKDVCKAVAWLGNSQVAYHDDSFAISFDGDPVFLTSCFQTGEFYVRKAAAAHGVKVMRVSQEALSVITIPLPPLSEQSAIGALFRNLDDLIALHQRKLDLLKNVKKSLLEGMFV